MTMLIKKTKMLKENVKKLLYINGTLHYNTLQNVWCATDYYNKERKNQDYCCFSHSSSRLSRKDKEIIVSTDYDIIINKSIILRHSNSRNRSSVKSILKWTRNIIVHNPQQNRPKVTVKHNNQEEEVFTVKAESNLFVTKQTAVWLLQKQILSKIGKGIYK